MAEVARVPDSFLPLTPAVFHILLALADGEKHGYAVMQEVEEMTEGKVEVIERARGDPGTDTGQQLEHAETRDPPDPTLDDERRRYYRQTGLGHKVLREETERMAELMALARRKHVLAGIGSRSILT